MGINTIKIVKQLMKEFASNTGLEPEFLAPKRYLWTDAFAVMNYLELYKKTHEMEYLINNFFHLILFQEIFNNKIKKIN